MGETRAPFLFCLMVCLPAAGASWSLGGAASTQAQPSATPARVENLANIHFKNDIRIFTVMAALNVAGFDYEAAGKEMSPVRRGVRSDLEQLDIVLRSRLQNFYRDHRQSRDDSEEQPAYTSLALLLSEPPEFEVQIDEKHRPADLWKVLGFEKLVQEFYRAAKIPALWQRYEPLYSAELAAYRPVFRDVIVETLRYFRTPPRIVLDREIVLIPDLLNARGIVNARNMERVYYVVVSPSDDPADNHIQLQHEYLHFLIDPLVEKYGATLLQHEKLLDLAQRQPRIKREHQNRYLVLVAESLIEGMLLRLHPPQDPDAALAKLFREGLIFAPYFYRGLKLYEQSELLAFPAYSESLFSEIREDKIRDDEKMVKAFEDKHDAVRAEELAAREKALREAERHNRINALLKEAGGLMSRREYDSAREKLEELLSEDPENGNALFYLAQIASQKKDYPKAFEYYRRVAQSSHVAAWVRAWAVLRTGNFLAFQGDVEGARSRFNEVLQMQGDLQGAREEAEKSLQRLPKQ